MDLPFVAPTVGDLVRSRRHDGDALYRVFDLRGRSATLSPLDGGEPTEAALDDLLVVKPFGEPIYPALAPLESVVRSEERPSHAVINGENLHVVQLLLYLYEGQVDCLYLDPPYNSGATDWKYNNRFVDATDRYRHSKWLSMMERRLRLAKRLLKPDGVLIVTIDENEVYHLGVLLDELFREYLRYQVTIVINPKGVAKANFARVEEYALFVVPAGAEIIVGEAVAHVDKGRDDEKDDGEWGLVRRRGSESRRHDRPSMFYPIYIDEQGKRVVRIGDPIPLEDEPDASRVEGLRPVWPIDGKGEHRRWQLGAASMRVQLDAGNLALGRYNKKQDSWTINIWRPKRTRRRLKTVWWEKRHDAGTHGTNIVDAFLGEPGRFPFPKSIYAVRDCLAAVCADRPDALIVDFFAGSGTTLHSTLLLNSEDRGRRRCVLVTNNELDPKRAKQLNDDGFFRGDPEFEARGIFESATRPRCRAAIEGKTASGQAIPGTYLDGRQFANGFDENVEFYRLDYLDPDQVELGQAFEAIHPALWLIASGKGPRPGDVDPSKPFYVAERAGYAILFDDASLRDFEKALEGRDDVTHVFVVTDSEEAFIDARELISHGRQSSMIYRDYLRTFRINTPRELE